MDIKSCLIKLQVEKKCKEHVAKATCLDKNISLLKHAQLMWYNLSGGGAWDNYPYIYLFNLVIHEIFVMVSVIREKFQEM